MAHVFSVVALLLGVIGALMLSQATLGVGMICLGVLAAILARLAQAQVHHDALTRSITEDLTRLKNTVEESARRS